MTLHDRLILFWGSMHIGEVIRRRALRRALSPLLRTGVRVLDVGCGRGDNALWIARRYPNVAVHAVDIAPELVVCVQQRVTDAGLRNISVQQADVEHSLFDIRHSSCSFGIVYSVDVFEHLRDPVEALVRIAGALADGGWCVLHVPQAHQRRWCARFAEYHQDDHEREGFDPQELAGMVARAGLHTVTLQHTFGSPGALAWELFHVLQDIARPLVLLAYPVLWSLAVMDRWFRWTRGNGLLVMMRKPIARSRQMQA